MKTNEHDYYSNLANWSFDDIDYFTESFTNWVYEEEIRKRVQKNFRVLDLGTAAGEKVLKYFPECAEILGTDFSSAMIEAANRNLESSGRKNVSFRVMDNLNMDTPDNYFDVVTARHTTIDPVQIFRTLKDNGQLILRGVDKLDCWALKRLFGRGQALNDPKPISLIDYERVMDAGFRSVELIPLHDVEYYKTKEDLYALLQKTPILDSLSEEKNQQYERKTIETDLFSQYVDENETSKGIKLVRRYYGIVAKK